MVRGAASLITNGIWKVSAANRWTNSTVKSLILGAPNPQTEMRLVSSCSCLCPIRWGQVLSREWRYSWSSADRRCSNYIWVIDNFIAYQGASLSKSFCVGYISQHTMISQQSLQIFGCRTLPVNILRPRQNGRHFPDDIFKCIFFMKMYEFWDFTEFCS